MTRDLLGLDQQRDFVIAAGKLVDVGDLPRAPAERVGGKPSTLPSLTENTLPGRDVFEGPHRAISRLPQLREIDAQWILADRHRLLSRASNQPTGHS